jgi:hypothetical protein
MVYDVPVRPDHLYDDLDGGEYVALSMDEQRVLAHSTDYDAMIAQLESHGESRYVLDIVPPKDAFLVF